jgi:hypothetical protein
MPTHPVTPSQQHSKSTQHTNSWETILSDAGLPSEPLRQRNTHQLLPNYSPKDDKRDFFDRNAGVIFEAKQEWKQSAGYDFTCLFCGFTFCGAPQGTKYCSDNHRKRHNEGKVYAAMCADCGHTIHPHDDNKDDLCGGCHWYNVRGLDRKFWWLFYRIIREKIWVEEYAAYEAERVKIKRGIAAPTNESYAKYCASLGIEPSLTHYESVLSTIRF